MKAEQFDEVITSLGKVITFLVEVKHRYFEVVDVPPVSESVERYLDEASRRCARVEDLQLNKRKVQSQKAWSEKELKEMPYLKDLKYRKTKDGIHQFRYRREGYNLSFNSKSYQKAREKAVAFIYSLKDKIRSETPAQNGKSLDYVFNYWINLKMNHSDEKTARAYLSVYNTHIKNVFGHRSVRGLLPVDLQPFFDELFSKKERTCESAKVILNGCFKLALANRLIPSNPMDGVIVERHFRKKGSSLTDEQLERFKVEMNGAGSLGLAALIILYTGIRGFELKSLTFDWEQGTFTVANAKLKKSQKTNEANLYRTVPIFPALYLLRERIEHEPWKIEPKMLSDYFSLRWRENTIKDLRHTFTTKARESGIENELVNLWTGHLPGNNQTANTYTHFSPTFQKEQAKKLKPY